MTSKLPSAASRTVSLFDGKTDMERAPDLGRDGSFAELERRPRARSGPRWKEARGTMSAWELVGGRVFARLERKGATYTAFVGGVGRPFPSLAEAASWAERESGALKRGGL